MCIPTQYNIYVIIIAYRNESKMLSGLPIGYHHGVILENIDNSCQYFIPLNFVYIYLKAI